VQYLNDLRIDHAKHLLETTDKQIIRISLDSGFNDLSHFNRTFKKIVGSSPSEYRKSITRDK
jgi:AraC-like DNA-binding protein